MPMTAPAPLAARTDTTPRDYPAEFDFIHTRMTIGCWSDMKRQIIRRAFDHLQPGGWLECQELPSLIACEDGTMPDDCTSNPSSLCPLPVVSGALGSKICSPNRKLLADIAGQSAGCGGTASSPPPRRSPTGRP